MIKSFSVSALILLCVSLFQTAILSNISILPSLPDFSMLCVLYFSLHNGRFMGEGTGFVSGLFIDFLSAGPFGVNCLFRTIMGYVGGLFNKTLNTRGFVVPALLGFIATLVKALILFIISLLYPASVLAYNPITWAFLFELACNTFLAPIVFKFLGLFRNSILLNPESVS